MSEIDEAEVRRIAELARLRLDDAEAEAYARDLEEILGHFRSIRELEREEDRQGPEGRSLAPRLRADVPDPDPLSREPDELAPQWRRGFFVVPRLEAMEGGEGGGEGEG